MARNQNIVNWIKSKSKVALALIGGLAVGGASSAAVLAAIPDTGGVIHACYRSSGLLANGTVRIIDSASATCNTNETAITWNQVGPQGPAGPTGPQGPVGDSARGEFLSDLSGIYLPNANLAYRDFAGVDFSGSDLSNTTFRGSDLHDANMSNVTLLSNSNGIQLLDLTDADLHGANLSGATIGGQGLDINRTNFSGANFTDTTFIGFFSQNIHENDFSEANFTRTVFNNEFTAFNFNDSVFTNAQFVDTSLVGANLGTADLTGATWDNVTCPDGTNSNDHGNTCIGHINP